MITLTTKLIFHLVVNFHPFKGESKLIKKEGEINFFGQTSNVYCQIISIKYSK